MSLISRFVKRFEVELSLAFPGSLRDCVDTVRIVLLRGDRVRDREWLVDVDVDFG